MQRARIRVTGDVQGVFYRYNAKSVAENLGIKGFIVNEADGSVSGVIEGENDMIEKFIVWCKEGSPMAEVKNVEVKAEEYKADFSKFEVK